MCKHNIAKESLGKMRKKAAKYQRINWDQSFIKWVAFWCTLRE